LQIFGWRKDIFGSAKNAFERFCFMTKKVRKRKRTKYDIEEGIKLKNN
jgi:hypothetical protein